RPTGRTFTIVGNACPLTRITTTTEVSLRKPTALENETPKPVVTLVYSRKPRKSKTNIPDSKSNVPRSVIQFVLWYLDSGCSKHMTGDRSQLTNLVNKFLGTVKFGNDHVAKILDYNDYRIGNCEENKVFNLGPSKIFPTKQINPSLPFLLSREGDRRPTGRTFTIVGNVCPLTRITTTTKVSLRKPTALENETPNPVVTLVYSRKPRKSKTNVPDSKSNIPRSVVQIVLWYLDFGCSKHMTGDRSQLTNFVNKFLGTVKFGNDHVAKILGYGDYQIGNVTISRVYYFLSQKDELRFLIKILKLIQVRLKVMSRIRTDNGTKFVNQTLREYYEKVGISYETSIARSPQQNGIVERRNRTLIEAARTMLIYAKALLFLWAEAIATTCYTQNRSIIRLRHGKIPYERLHDKPPDLSFFHVFGALCYPTNNSENLGKLQPKADIDFDELTAMASEHSSSGPALHEMTPATISSGLVQNPPSSTPVDLPAHEVIAPIDEVVAPVPAVSTGSPSSTTVDQDAPSPSNSQTTPETQHLVITNDVEEDNHDIEIAHIGNDPYFGIPILEIPSDQSSSSDSIHTISVFQGGKFLLQALLCYTMLSTLLLNPRVKDALDQSSMDRSNEESS
ncbi:retrovirus-related pol polyprotein from transposon TNT 1-94, partial [Tanacetum coccineum]